MTRATFTVITMSTLLWTGAARATPSAQQQCDSARIVAWGKYVSCVDAVVAKDAKCHPSCTFDENAAFAKCRHTYFKNWTAFQKSAALATSTCVGNRLTDNGTTVTDNLTGLVWEKKTNDASVHNEGNYYTWSTGAPWVENGTAFTTFLTAGLNTPGFAGANGWRLPTLAELQTTLKDFACTGAFGESKCSCGTSPCIDATFGPTQSSYYWSSTNYQPTPGQAWFLYFYDGEVHGGNKDYEATYVRAVRGGL